MRLEEARQLLERLRLPAGDYALHGSGPLLAHGIVDEIADLDVVARGAAWEEAKRLAPVSRGDRDDVVRPLPGVEIFDGWLDDDADALIEGASLVSGMPCVSLEAVLSFKRRLGRPKDLEHVRLIERHLAGSSRG